MFRQKRLFQAKKMEVLYSDNAEAIREYLSTPEGLRNINTKKWGYCTPLYHACYANRNDVVDVLIEFGANVNKISKSHRQTPLHVACERGYVDIVIRLLNESADPNIPNLYGTTPIMYAVLGEHLNIVKLLTIYTDFNTVDNIGYTIFTYAIRYENNDIIDYIFDYCTNINHTDYEGWSYLHWAVFYGNIYAISLLLRKGIDTEIENNNGEKVRDWSTDPEILALLGSFS